MGITINADNLDDARDKLRLRETHWPIKIRFVNGNDYGREPKPGCIVDAVGAPDQEVARQFVKNSDALRYIASILKKREEYVRAELEARKTEARKAVQKSASRS
jgi:hypothetical protein